MYQDEQDIYFIDFKYKFAFMGFSFLSTAFSSLSIDCQQLLGIAFVFLFFLKGIALWAKFNDDPSKPQKIADRNLKFINLMLVYGLFPGVILVYLFTNIIARNLIGLILGS